MYDSNVITSTGLDGYIQAIAVILQGLLLLLQVIQKKRSN